MHRILVLLLAVVGLAACTGQRPQMDSSDTLPTAGSSSTTVTTCSLTGTQTSGTVVPPNAVTYVKAASNVTGATQIMWALQNNGTLVTIWPVISQPGQPMLNIYTTPGETGYSIMPGPLLSPDELKPRGLMSEADQFYLSALASSEAAGYSISEDIRLFPLGLAATNSPLPYKGIVPGQEIHRLEFSMTSSGDVFASSVTYRC